MTSQYFIGEMPVAVFDILGFGNKTREMELIEIYRQILRFKPIYEFFARAGRIISLSTMHCARFLKR